MDKLFSDLKAGKIKPYELEEKLWDGKEGTWAEANKKAADLRLKLLEEKTGKRFERIRHSYVDTSSVRKGNPTSGIEQKIGGASIPLGLGGPIKILGEYAKGEFYLPMATNEAALVAGLTRGSKAINLAGGLKVKVTRDAMARAPVVEAPSIDDASRLAEEIRSKGALYKEMKEAAESESRVSKLLDIQPFQMGRMVHLRMQFQTGDSMGMNSATKYSANAVEVLMDRNPKFKLLSLTGNLCTDKKASHSNVLLGRGKSVETEVLVPADVVKKVFGVSPEEMVKLNFVKNYQGSALAGTLTGFNVNVANAIAALFVATGQDAAQIVESSSCFIRAELAGKDLLFGASFPCLEVATVGGGTGFGTARECLEILDCAGPGKSPGDNSRKLAEIIAAAATAQDLNTLGAQAHKFELAESHIKLARGK